ncbi:glutathione S-transferase [Sphingobium lactosutens]|uniref:glutathione S-transferase N-terminal domain-containing protein n=1 Tax=Sphingobium lactosutens TaxID=522773 RepID=UPI0015C1ABD4|nr:glutathione S-transferase N-terminal domain-containing protein [Sphingobium lactosutens]NWK96200.1 glutathione S-transferase [Sphingobium lactosutens]
MIDFYTLTSPNVRKIFLMLEECELPYKNIFVDVWKGDNFDPDFLKLNPNAKIPVIVDHDGPGGKPITVFESGAILMYLAEKAGKFMPLDPTAKYQVIQWIFVQVGTVGPMLGQLGYFKMHGPKEGSEHAVARYTTEVDRIYKMIDKRLGESRFIGGDDYSVADMAFYPWCGERISAGKIGFDLDNYPNVIRWAAEIAERPASKRVAAFMPTIQSVRDNPTPEDFDRLWRRNGQTAA